MSIYSLVMKEFMNAPISNSYLKLNNLMYILNQKIPKDFILSYARDYIFFNNKHNLNQQQFWNLYNKHYKMRNDNIADKFDATEDIKYLYDSVDKLDFMCQRYFFKYSRMILNNSDCKDSTYFDGLLQDINCIYEETNKMKDMDWYQQIMKLCTLKDVRDNIRYKNE